MTTSCCSNNEGHDQSGNTLVPQPVRVVNIVDETSDVKNFWVTPENGIPFKVKPGQLCMVSVLPVGEGMFSVTWSGEDHLQFAIRRVGLLTNALHEIQVGQQLGIRGPYGNGFPIEECQGKDLLFIAGGIGLAPVRSFIKYCFNHREEFGKIQILYGARSYDDLCFKSELIGEWPKQPDTEVYVTLDRPEEGWEGHVGFVPAYLEEINPLPQNKVAVICGPPIMIKLVLKSLEAMGYEDEQVITTLEMRMKCGIGKCGRCNLGAEYICLDGPVFNLAQLKKLPPEW